MPEENPGKECPFVHGKVLFVHGLEWESSSGELNHYGLEGPFYTALSCCWPRCTS